MGRPARRFRSSRLNRMGRRPPPMMTEPDPQHGQETPLPLVLPMGLLALVHAVALGLGTSGEGERLASFGAWGQVNIGAALAALVAFALILRRYREGHARPDPTTLAWAVAAADLAAVLIAAVVLRPLG